MRNPLNGHSFYIRADRLKLISPYKRPIECMYTTHNMCSGLHHIFNVLQEMQNMEAHLEGKYGRDSDGELNV